MLVVLDPGQPFDRVADAELGGELPPGPLLGAGTEHGEPRLDAAAEQLGQPSQAKMHALPVQESAGEQEPERRARAVAPRAACAADLARADLEAKLDLVPLAVAGRAWRDCAVLT